MPFFGDSLECLLVPLKLLQLANKLMAAMISSDKPLDDPLDKSLEEPLDAS